jgi:hypothetical protein
MAATESKERVRPVDDNAHHDDEDFHLTSMTPSEYLRTRFSSLKPPMTRPPNPITVLRSLTFMNWMMFLCAFLGWSWDAFDFFTVSLTGEYNYLVCDQAWARDMPAHTMASW